ncbi:Pumilio homolog 4 [Zea mays]|uniref:Pumilio homolog 4 n=1 Tax=Zea mays TaxID=4577 RepID=A0A1D6HPP6_MAIZE|nr:Pumilio homolog 4 [Zea mays]AQK76246.1 Pumilio homolog 4 [Zea mays]
MAPSQAAAVVAGPTFEDLERDLQAVLMDQNHTSPTDDLSIFRSGSAPPTVEGSRTAIGALFPGPQLHANSLGDGGGGGGTDAGVDMLTEEEIRSHPAYLSYYYSNEHLNPRLPPPMVSKEDWRAAQRFQAVSGGIGDRRRPSEVGSGNSLFSVQPGAHGEKALLNHRVGRGERNGLARQQSSEWLGRGADGLIGLSDVSGHGSRRKSFADALQENISRTAATAGHLSRSNSRNALEGPTPIRSSDSPKPQLQHRSESMNGLRSGSTSPSLVRVQSLGSSMSHTFASAVGSSISRSTTPDPQLIRRTPSPCLPPVGVRMGSSDKKVEAAAVASLNHDNADIAATLSSLNLSGNKMSIVENQAQNHVYQNFGDQTDVLFNVPKEHMQFSPQILSQNTDDGSFNAPEYVVFPNGGSNFSNSHASKLASHSNIKFSMQPPHGNLNKKGSLMSSPGSVSHYHNLNGDSHGIDVSGQYMKTHAGGFTSSMLNNQLNPDGDYGNVLSNNGVSGYQGQQETMYAQYLQANSDSPLGAAASMSPFQGRGFTGSGHLDSPGYQKAYLGTLFAQQKLQYGMPYLGKSGALNQSIYGSDPAFGIGMTYLTSPPSSQYISSPRGHVRQADRPTRLPAVRNTAGGSLGSWNSENGLMDNGYGSSLLEEFKTNKSRSFELLDIIGHVVEFRYYFLGIPTVSSSFVLI